jgi:hydroxyacylglutathione hydrolase
MKNWMTRKGVQVSRILAGRSNVFLISFNGTNILIDTSSKRLWGRLNRRLALQNINSVEYLMLTHVHFDHAGNAAQIKRKFGSRVIINSREQSCLERGENPLTGSTVPVIGPLINKLIKYLDIIARFEPCKADDLVDERMELDINGINILILWTPGHTDGSQCIIVDNEIALVGDTMFGVFPGFIMPPFGLDTNRLRGSWKVLFRTGCRLYLPSHGYSRSRETLYRAIVKSE